MKEISMVLYVLTGIAMVVLFPKAVLYLFEKHKNRD